MALNINGTTGISGVDGSASAPAVTGTDSNTGINFASDTVNINTGGITRAKVDSAGNLGLGTSSPTAASGETTLNIFANEYPELHLTSSVTGTAATDGSIFTLNNDNSTVIRNQENSYIRFDTNGSNERMRISSSGALSVGSTANTFGGSILAVNGYYVSAYNGDNLVTNASQGGGSATLYIGNAAIQVSSDQRIKKNIVDTTLDATTKLKQVRVVDFKWNDPTDKAEVNRNSRGTWTGCLAQEMVNIFPYTVNAPRKDDNSIDTESERTWGLEYQHLVPALIKGFQEQQARIETLETKVAALEAK